MLGSACTHIYDYEHDSDGVLLGVHIVCTAVLKQFVIRIRRTHVSRRGQDSSWPQVGMLCMYRRFVFIATSATVIVCPVVCC